MQCSVKHSAIEYYEILYQFFNTISNDWLNLNTKCVFHLSNFYL